VLVTVVPKTAGWVWRRKKPLGPGSFWMLTGISTAMGEVVGALTLEKGAKGEKSQQLSSLSTGEPPPPPQVSRPLGWGIAGPGTHMPPAVAPDSHILYSSVGKGIWMSSAAEKAGFPCE